MHHKMRRGWSTPYVGLKKCRSHLLLEVQKTSLPFWKTFTINNVSWLIKDHISLLRTFPFLFFITSLISSSFFFFFYHRLSFPFFPVFLQRVTRTKKINYTFFSFREKYEKYTRLSSRSTSTFGPIENHDWYRGTKRGNRDKTNNENLI